MNYSLAFLAQIIVYLLLFLANDYVGTLLALIVSAVCFGVWAVSLIVEWIEPSPVPPAFYRYMFTGWLAPITATVVYAIVHGGARWMTE